MTTSSDVLRASFAHHVSKTFTNRWTYSADGRG
jgi:hypothetical protein